MLITSFGPISWTVCIIANFATDLSRIPPRALVCSVLREEFQALLWFRGLTGRLFFYLSNGCSRGCFWRKRSSPLKAQTCKKNYETSTQQATNLPRDEIRTVIGHGEKAFGRLVADFQTGTIIIILRLMRFDRFRAAPLG